MIYRDRIYKTVLLSAIFFLNGCASSFLKYDKAEKLKDISEFDSSVKIVIPADQDKEDENTNEPVQEKASTTTTTLKKAAKVTTKASAKKVKSSKPVKAERRQPVIESDLGFQGRRPLKDPFRVGEKVIHDVTYLSMTAGTLTLEVKPFAEVDGKKAYNFKTAIKTSSLFNSIYSVDDYVTTLVDFETLVPSVYSLHVKESSQLREARMFADSKNNTATFWEKKVTKKNGEEEKKLQWSILPYAQNVFSIVFYLRTFQWSVGVEHVFNVADNGKNILFKAKAIRREKISTDVGEFDAIVIRPEIELEGKFKSTGENYIWLSDDDRKIILRIESKIKIGSLVSEIVKFNKGQ